MPDDFIPYAHQEKTVLSAANNNSIKANEIIFTNEKTFKKLNKNQKILARLNFSEQLSLF